MGCCLLWKSASGNKIPSVNHVVLAKSEQSHSQTRRKTRFDQFATIEVDGQYLMTPADFLESVMHRELPGITIIDIQCTCIYGHTPINFDT